MKLCFINPSPESTGIGKYAKELINNMNKLNEDKNINIDYIYLNFDDKSIDIINNGNLIKKVKPMIFKLGFKRPIFYLLCYPFLPKYDYYHLSTQNLSYFMIKNSIITCHDLIHRISPKNKLNLMMSYIYYIGLKKSKLLLSDSLSTKEDIIKYIKYPKDKIFITQLAIGNNYKVMNKNKVNSIKNKYSLPNDKKIIFHISSEQPRKNVDNILKSIKIISEKNKNILFVKAGKAQFNKDHQKHINLTKELEIKDYVKFIDYVPEEDLPALYNGASLFVYPSFYEGFGLPPLEAMACGCPVITSNTSSLPEVVGDAGIMVDPNNIDELAKQMQRVLNDKKLRKSMIEKGLKQAKKFSWEKCARETLEVYGEVLDEKK